MNHWSYCLTHTKKEYCDCYGYIRRSSPNHVPKEICGDCIPQCLECFQVSGACYCLKPRWSACYSDIVKAKTTKDKPMNIEEIKQEVLFSWRPAPKNQDTPQLQQAIQDLEYQRWWLHQKWIAGLSDDSRRSLTTQGYWKEIGAFYCSLSRQQGKSTLINKIARELLRDDQFVYVATTNNAMTTKYKPTNSSRYQVLVIDHLLGQIPAAALTGCHLFVDETFGLRDRLDEILKYDWRSVSIFGNRE